MKQSFCLLLAAVLIFSLASCGKNSAPTDPQGTAGEQLKSQPATENITEAPTEAPTEPAIIYIMTSKTYILDGVVTSYEEYNTQGRLIKEIEGAPGSPGGYTYEYTYDENGNCIKKVYTENGFPSEYTYYTYDEKGNMVKKDEIRPQSELHYGYAYNDAGQMVKEWDTASNGGSTTFEYDSRGFMIRKSRYLHDATEPYEIREYAYDENGNKIKESSLTNGMPFELFTWTYDENGNMTSELPGIYYDGENLEYKLAYRWLYDEHSNLIGESDDPYNEEVTPHTKYTYNDAGEILEAYTIQSDGKLVLSYTNTYAEDGLLSCRTNYAQDGSVSSTSVTTRNEQGQALSVTCQKSDGSTYTSEEHVYDENGNLLSSSYSNGVKWEYTYVAIENPNR